MESLLNKGDLIDVVAPSSKLDIDILRKGIQFLESQGYNIRCPKDLFGKSYFSANSVEKRLSNFKKAANAKDSKLLWCARGGYGLTELMPSLIKFKPKSKKTIIGYSDISLLLNWSSSQWKWNAIHWRMLGELGRGDFKNSEWARLNKLFSGEKFNLSVKPLNQTAKSATIRFKKIYGGNLAVLVKSVGTPWCLSKQVKGKPVLLLEDIGERGYKVHSYLMQLEQSGVLKKFSAIYFGEFTNANEPGIKKSLVPEALKSFSKGKSLPMYWKAPVGHGSKHQPFIIG